MEDDQKIECPKCGWPRVWVGATDFDAADAADNEAIQVRECPKCDFNLVWEGKAGDGFECPDCGEIFEVPIVPENGIDGVIEGLDPIWVAEPPHPPGFSFVLKSEDLSPSFAKLVGDYFGKPWRI